MSTMPNMYATCAPAVDSIAWFGLVGVLLLLWFCQCPKANGIRIQSITLDCVEYLAKLIFLLGSTRRRCLRSLLCGLLFIVQTLDLCFDQTCDWFRGFHNRTVIKKPNDPAQAGRASGLRLSTERLARPCLKPDGSALWSSLQLLPKEDTVTPGSHSGMHPRRICLSFKSRLTNEQSPVPKATACAEYQRVGVDTPRLYPWITGKNRKYSDLRRQACAGNIG